MELILWRHAEAEDGVPDLSRKLTSKGIKQAEKVAAMLRLHLPVDTRILVSPAARTRQTASALTANFKIIEDIGTGASAQSVLNAAGWPDAGGTALVVGHQPTLGEVAAKLLDSSQHSLNIKKGALWWFTRRAHGTETQANLRLVITPEFL